MKEYSTFSKVPALEPHHQMKISIIIRTLFGDGSFPSAEVLSAYTTTLADKVDEI